ncbi:hypothetical protein D3C71_1029550 [compost metagenome]
MKKNLIDASGFRVQRNLMKQMNQQLSHAAQRIEFVFALAGLGHFFQRLMQGVEHGLHQIRLVAEMPVNGPASDAGQGRDVRQGRARHASLEKGLFGRHENLRAGFLSFLFGTTDHGSTTSIRVLQRCLNIS